jgi:YesN/AraC family two-component response regulator
MVLLKTTNENEDHSVIVKRTLLLVDDEKNILSSLERLLRDDGYSILTATSGKEGLELLEKNEIGVIISDQRMPVMTGTEFFSRVKKIYPMTVRIVLSGYSEFKAITDSINEGAIYKFISKPWDDVTLRANIEESFQHYELKQENKKLTEKLTVANKKLLQNNLKLEHRVEQKTHDVMLSMRTLQVSQEILESLSIIVLGVEDGGVVVVANSIARKLLGRNGKSLVGTSINKILPKAVIQLYKNAEEEKILKIDKIKIDDSCSVEVCCYRMGQTSHAKGTIVVMTPKYISNNN